jgi:hypothetical protein
MVLDPGGFGDASIDVGIHGIDLYMVGYTFGIVENLPAIVSESGIVGLSWAVF